MKRNKATGRAEPYGPNEIILLPDATIGIIITRTNGDTHTAIIDQADYHLVFGHRWWFCGSKPSHYRNTAYALTIVRDSDGKRRHLSMHSLLAGGPGIKVDHSNMNGLDNTRQNLRPRKTNHGNAQNRIKNRNNTSGYKGVYRRKDNGRYSARIAVYGKRIDLGSYSTAVEAGRAYDAAARIHHGEFARTNFGTELATP